MPETLAERGDRARDPAHASSAAHPRPRILGQASEACAGWHAAYGIAGTGHARDYCGGMAGEVQAPFWAKVIATFTGCASIGALAGLMGGALTKDVGRGLVVGIVAGLLVALALVILKPDRIRGD